MIKKNICNIFLFFIVILLPFFANAEDVFTPGFRWPDNNGAHINAHGGGVINHNGKYYWFGEDKGAGRDGNLAKTGVHLYSSGDLYNWRDEGLALKVSDDPSSPVASGCRIERPKVIYNETTRKFVMWFHLELKGQGYGAARVGVAESDDITGPFMLAGSFRPDAGSWPVNVQPDDKTPGPRNRLARDFADGQMARDMNIFKDDNGKAYLIYVSEDNSTLHIAELSDDYTHTTGQYSRILPGAYNEAPAVFKHNGHYYMITSGQTGWAPNAARAFMAKDIMGSWTSLGNPVQGSNEDMSKTFFSQSTSILPVPGEQDRFIFMGDRWTPKNPVDGRYIWLPLKWDGDRPVLYWSDRWRYQDAFSDVVTFKGSDDNKWTAAGHSHNWINPASSSAMSWPQGGFAIFQGPARTVGVEKSADSAGKLAEGVYFSGVWFASDGQVIAGDDLIAVPTATGARLGGQMPGPDELLIRVSSDEKHPFTAVINSAIRESDKKAQLALVKTDSGRLILNGANQYRGGTRIDGGTLQVSADNNLGNASGPLTLNGGTLALGASFNPSATRKITLAENGGSIDTAGHDMTLGQDVTGPGGLFKLGAGALTLAGKNTWAGGTYVTDGILNVSDTGTLPYAGKVDVARKGSLRFLSGQTSPESQTVGSLTGSGKIDLGSSMLTVGKEDTNGFFDGVISGTGSLIKQGAGILVLSGDSNYTGPTQIDSGLLIINGSLASDIIVNTGGTLAGGGSIDGLSVASGGVMISGLSGPPLQVNGNAGFAPGSLYRVEITRDGRSSVLEVAGVVTFDGDVDTVADNSANLLALKQVPSFDGRTFRIIKTREGAIAQADRLIKSSLFLDTILNHDRSDIMLTTRRNNRPFASVTVTPNERAVATAVDSLPGTEPVRESLLLSDSAEEVREAFHQLSGQVHADMTSAVSEASWLVRDTLTDRMRQRDGEAVSPGVVSAADGGTWVKMLGNEGHTASANGSDGYNDSTRGVLLGADHQKNGWQYGLSAGYTRTSLRGGNSTGASTSNNGYLAGYTGLKAGAFALHTGAVVGWHAISTDRTVSYGLQLDRDNGHYNARSGQVFADAGYGLLSGQVSLEPFAGLSYGSLMREGFRENGGAAALGSDRDETRFLLSDAGVRSATRWSLSQDTTLIFRAEAGWQHRFESLNRETTLQFNTGSAFSVISPAVSREGLLLKTGIAVMAGENVTLSLNYAGLLSAARQDNSGSANLSWRF